MINNRLLIVDDEAAVTDWLVHLLEEHCGDKTEIYCSNNSKHALEMIRKARFDVVVLDINMPVMNGMVLMDHILELWPDTLLIFLTGFEDFHYAKKAVGNNVMAYLLKNEDDQELIEAVDKAFEQIQRNMENKQLLVRAKQQAAAALPVLKREMLQSLLHHTVKMDEIQNGKACPVEWRIDLTKPIWLMVCAPSFNKKGAGSFERTKSVFAVDLLLEDLFDQVFVYEYAKLDGFVSVWLVQANDDIAETKSKQRLTSLLDKALKMYEKSVGEHLLIVHTHEPVPPMHISYQYSRLRLLLGHANEPVSAILTELDLELEDAPEENSIQTSAWVSEYSAGKLAPIMQRLLEQGEELEFFNNLERLLLPLHRSSDPTDSYAAELFLSIASILLSYVNRMNLNELVGSKIPLFKLYRMDTHASWLEAGSYFRNVAEIIFEVQRNRRENRVATTVSKAKQYIIQHLHEDLSLITIAEHIYLNPSYFSALFKTKTGLNVSEFIRAERLKRAKALLAEGKMKIQDVAKQVGYRNAAYFTRFFKGEAGMTPQEYRDHLK